MMVGGVSHTWPGLPIWPTTEEMLMMRPAFFFNMILAACCVCACVCAWVFVFVFACVSVCLCVSVLFLHHDDLGRLLCDARLCTDLRNLLQRVLKILPMHFAHLSTCSACVYNIHLHVCQFSGLFFAGSGVEDFIVYRTHTKNVWYI